MFLGRQQHKTGGGQTTDEPRDSRTAALDKAQFHCMLYMYCIQ